jgi:DDE superfamily endonuclease
MVPPENAIVLCVDEKPSIQALERAQGYVKMPNGRALGEHSHDYKRNGTSTLFAAFEVATGKVTAAHKKRRRRIEFLDFMNDIVAAWPDKAIHVVLDNLNTHKPKNDRWLKRHPNVTFHFTAVPGLMAQPGRDLVLNSAAKVPVRRILHLRQNSSESTLMHSLMTTTPMPGRSSGPNPKSTKAP